MGATLLNGLSLKLQDTFSYVYPLCSSVAKCLDFLGLCLLLMDIVRGYYNGNCLDNDLAICNELLTRYMFVLLFTLVCFVVIESNDIFREDYYVFPLLTTIPCF